MLSGDSRACSPASWSPSAGRIGRTPIRSPSCSSSSSMIERGNWPGCSDVRAEFAEVLQEIGRGLNVLHRNLVFILEPVRELLRQPAGPPRRIRGDKDFV